MYFWRKYFTKMQTFDRQGLASCNACYSIQKTNDYWILGIWVTVTIQICLVSSGRLLSKCAITGMSC